MKERNRVVITVEGGLIQGITADNPETLNILIMDYDADGASNLPRIRNHFGGRKLEPCNIYKEKAGSNKKMLNNYFKQYENIIKGIAI